MLSWDESDAIKVFKGIKHAEPKRAMIVTAMLACLTVSLGPHV